MIKVNLVSKKSRVYSGRNWTKIVTFSLFGLFFAYFLSVTLYLVISISWFNRQLGNMQKESVGISSTMLENNEKLSRFVLTKLILGQIESVNKSRFQYLNYLDQISFLLPPKTSLTGIDFKVKGWISMSVLADDVFAFQALENILSSKSTWGEEEYFTGAYIESVSKNKDNGYTVRLQLELKGNG